MASMRQKGATGQISAKSLRSLHWKIYLDYFPSLETDAWTMILSKERESYTELKRNFLSNPGRDQTPGDLDVNNPLSLEADSPWTQYFKDTELRKVINQDVERTMPDQPFFRKSSVQEVLSNILFVWSKVNPDISYRQGMHELLAPVLFIVDEDKAETSESSKLDALQATVFDGNFVEHDAFVLFSRIMRSTKVWFEVGQESSGRLKAVKGGMHDDPRRRGENELIKVLDPELHAHLNTLGIEPQLYGLRWLRLLFGREFEFADLLILWDGLFADDPNLGLVDWSLDTTVVEFIASAKGLRELYAQKALNGASVVARAEETSPVVVASGAAKTYPGRRTHGTPWTSHTAAAARPPLQTRTSPPLSRSQANEPAAAASLPVQPATVPPATGTPTITEAAANPFAARAALLETRVAALQQARQRTAERDRALAKKLESCIAVLGDVRALLPAEGGGGSRNGSGGEGSRGAAELDGVVDVLRVVMAELDAPAPAAVADVVQTTTAATESRPHSPASSTSPAAAEGEDHRPVRRRAEDHQRAASLLRDGAPAAVTGRAAGRQAPPQHAPAGAASAGVSAAGAAFWPTSLAAVAQDVDSSAKAAANTARRLFQDLFENDSLASRAATGWRSSLQFPPTPPADAAVDAVSPGVATATKRGPRRPSVPQPSGVGSGAPPATAARRASAAPPSQPHRRLPASQSGLPAVYEPELDTDLVSRAVIADGYRSVAALPQDVRRSFPPPPPPPQQQQQQRLPVGQRPPAPRVGSLAGAAAGAEVDPLAGVSV
ncbi:TBC1 domain, member 5 [Cladochytrium tenue]|nr:TBC1 domain, member 5 [Cladochytrium tenue]